MSIHQNVYLHFCKIHLNREEFDRYFDESNFFYFRKRIRHRFESKFFVHQ